MLLLKNVQRVQSDRSRAKDAKIAENRRKSFLNLKYPSPIAVILAGTASLIDKLLWKTKILVLIITYTLLYHYLYCQKTQK